MKDHLVTKLPYQIGKGLVINIVVSAVVMGSLHLFFYLFG